MANQVSGKIQLVVCCVRGIAHYPYSYSHIWLRKMELRRDSSTTPYGGIKGLPTRNNEICTLYATVKKLMIVTPTATKLLQTEKTILLFRKSRTPGVTLTCYIPSIKYFRFVRKSQFNGFVLSILY